MVIAVVDDDRGVLKALGRLLSELGYCTELFASAEEFLNSEAKTKAACLVVDIDLGEVSGLELVRQISLTGSGPPVIFMSGSKDAMIHKQAMDLGSVAYLHKPFAPDLLVAAIAKAIGSNLSPG